MLVLPVLKSFQHNQSQPHGIYITRDVTNMCSTLFSTVSGRENVMTSLLGVQTSKQMLNGGESNPKQDNTRQDKTFMIKISPVQFLGTQLAEKR